jgi:hypothetical protein
MPFRDSGDSTGLKGGWTHFEPCQNSEHNPPGYIVLKPGVHTWVCPGCGKEQIVTVSAATL